MIFVLYMGYHIATCETFNFSNEKEYSLGLFLFSDRNYNNIAAKSPGSIVRMP